MTNQIDDYINKGKKEGYTLKKFVYDHEKYQQELHQRTALETFVNKKKTELASRCYHGFSELFIALMHLKVIRVFIDGVLRFGIPPRFYIGIIKPSKGMEREVLKKLNHAFAT